MVLALISSEGKKFSQLVAEFDTYPASGEINFAVPDSEKAIQFIRTTYTDAKSTDELDGLSVWYENYWFNIRTSKTEPLIRLNVEADTADLLKQKTDELIAHIQSQGGTIK
jgi:phosphomannomutase